MRNRPKTSVDAAPTNSARAPHRARPTATLRGDPPGCIRYPTVVPQSTSGVKSTSISPIVANDAPMRAVSTPSDSPGTLRGFDTMEVCGSLVACSFPVPSSHVHPEVGCGATSGSGKEEEALPSRHDLARLRRETFIEVVDEASR